MLIRTISHVVDVAFLILTGKLRKSKHPDYRCDLRKAGISWLAYSAFRKVLVRKQTVYAQVLDWLEKELHGLSQTAYIRRGRVSKIV